MSGFETLPAHAGGWDEALYFGLPVVLAVLGVRWAEKRARRKREAEEETRPD
jgi:hypothetical protein